MRKDDIDGQCHHLLDSFGRHGKALDGRIRSKDYKQASLDHSLRDGDLLGRARRHRQDDVQTVLRGCARLVALGLIFPSLSSLLLLLDVGLHVSLVS